MQRATSETTALIYKKWGAVYFCASHLPPAIAGNGPYATKAQAMEAAAVAGFRFAEGSGTYWKGVRAIPEHIRARAIRKTISIDQSKSSETS